MIVETPDRLLWAVTETGDASQSHSWWSGTQVRRAKIRGTYERKPGAEPQAVRKAEARVVSQFRLRD